MATDPLLDLTGFRGRTLMAAPDLDFLEAREPGWILGRLKARTGWLYARLAKRYETPFSSSEPPEAAADWLVDLVTLDCFLKRGFDPETTQNGEIQKRFDTAKTEIAEAADSEDGKFELPLRGLHPIPGEPEAITRGGPLGYSEASPYTWKDVQREAVRR